MELPRKVAAFCREVGDGDLEELAVREGQGEIFRRVRESLDFLSEIGKKLAERWVAALAVPGLLYLAVAVIAWTLGHSHAVDAVYMSAQVTAWAKDSALWSAGGTVLVAAAVLAGSVMGPGRGGAGAPGREAMDAAWGAPSRALAGRPAA